MDSKISVVVNTLNSQSSIEKALKSVDWADEMMICDMQSEDNTVAIAKKIGARVISYKRLEYVEPARNFAISKATGDWILIIDPDEEVPQSLGERLRQIASVMEQIDYVRIPRKNIIFGHWMKASMWWPDLNIRFFKKGKVSWGDKIHRPPHVEGAGLDLTFDEKWAIIHYHYNSIPEFLERMIRYTKIQAEELKKEGYNFNWVDLVKQPLGEFLGRFFANKGYEDGLYGFSLSLLQAFSHLIVYLRVWEMEKYKNVDITIKEFSRLSEESGREIDYWLKYANLSKNPFKRFVQKVKNKI